LMVFVGVCWCLLVFVGVCWCLFVFVGVGKETKQDVTWSCDHDHILAHGRLWIRPNMYRKDTTSDSAELINSSDFAELINLCKTSACLNVPIGKKFPQHVNASRPASCQFE
jgi:hypothetical protein